jgi:queuine tRNA-ribosyltransferase
MTLSYLDFAHGQVKTPVYLPDATFGVVRSVDAADLEEHGITALVMNTFHLMQHPGTLAIQSLGGLHRMSGWNGPIITDSGGFQAYSLIRQNPKMGQIQEKGILFRPEGSDRKVQLTPEKTVQLQVAYGSDVVICLDDCTHVDEGIDAQKTAVDRTITWAKRSRQEFDRLAIQKKWQPNGRPKLFAVIQGGGSKDLRKRCTDALLEIGFDGFGYGGWPLDKENNLLTEIIGYSRELVPPEFPMHALGVGHPENVLACHDLGYEIFDSAMPTRDARHGRLYRFETSPADSSAGLTGKWLSYHYVNDERHIRSDAPIDEDCDCLCCRRYSAGYLHHLFKQGDTLFMRLATLHNLRFMVRLTDRIRQRAANAS